MAGVGFSSEDKVQEGREGRPRPDFERSAEVYGLHRPKQSSQEKVYRLLSRLNLDRTQAAIILVRILFSSSPWQENYK